MQQATQTQVPDAAALSRQMRQRLLLEAEGLRFDAAGRISLARQGWKPRRSGRVVTARARGGFA